MISVPARGILTTLCVLATMCHAALLPMPHDVARSILDFGAVGDGVHDDTRAIQLAIDTNRTEDIDYNGRPKTVYFPAGTYLVSGTLDWIGCAMTLMGQGIDATVIRLAPGAPGFGDANAPKAVIRSPAGNMSFRQNVQYMTVEIGAGNPGAVALDYISSNSGTVRDVRLAAAQGSGLVGLDMTRAWPGPLLITNLSVEGFAYGIKVRHSEYGPTFENITLKNQRTAGLHNEGNVCAIRKLTSENSVPGIVNTPGHGYVILLDGTFRGGARGVSAIENVGHLYLRSVSCAGSAYRSVAAIGDSLVGGQGVDELVTGAVKKLWDSSPSRSLGLPVSDVPEFHEADTARWAAFRPRWYGDTGPLQDLLNSGATTVYFPAGVYFNHATARFTVPATVRRIVGFHSVINRNQGPAAIMFQVAENGANPLIVEQFGYGVGVEHSSKRTVAIKHGGYYYSASAGAGDLFFDDVQGDNLTFLNGQSVWMRQLNTEGPELHVTNNGARLWILGVKTEGKGTVIRTTGGGFTEVLGTLLYPCQSFVRSDPPAFVIDNGHASYIYRVSSYVTDGNYWNQVAETRGTETRTWVLETNTASICPLFSGFDSTANAVTPKAGRNRDGARRSTPRRSASTRLTLGAVVLAGGSVFDIRGRVLRRRVCGVAAQSAVSHPVIAAGVR